MNKNKIKCEICNKLISTNNIKKHISACITGKIPYIKKYECPHCNLSLNTLPSRSRANHVHWCVSNPNRVLYVENLQNTIEARTKKIDYKKISEGVKQAHKDGKYNHVNRSFNKGRIHTEETKQKISIGARKAIKNGRTIKAGRCKKIEYISPISGKFTVDGSWELKFCQWCDSNNIIIKRTGLRFIYIKPNKKESYYHPDFKIDEYYIEIKGYETELDRCKWSQFKYNLIILRSEQIKNLYNYHTLNDLKQFIYRLCSVTR